MFNLVGQVERLKKRWPQVTFRVVDFATLSLKEQVFLAHETDVLVGVTGAAMTHIYGSLRNLALWKS
jgi:capsular polysaccharide biosynthesis protein